MLKFLERCVVCLSCCVVTLMAQESAHSDSHKEAGISAFKLSRTPPQELPPCLEPIQLPQEEPCHHSHQIQLGANYTYAWITPRGSSTLSGSLGGVQMLYEYGPCDALYAAAFFHWRVGKVSRGSSARSLMDVHVQERLGYTFCFPCPEVTLSLFSGVGARYMPQRVSAGSSIVHFDYTHLYLPVGFVCEKHFELEKIRIPFDWGLCFQWMPQIFSVVHISPSGGAYWNIAYRLNNFWVEAPLKFSCYSKDLRIILSPFIECWHDGASTAATQTGLTLGLPRNSYLFTGLNLSVNLSF